MSENDWRKILSEPLEEGVLNEVVDIAERALWNPAIVPDDDIQKLAAAVISQVWQKTIFQGQKDRWKAVGAFAEITLRDRLEWK